MESVWPRRVLLAVGLGCAVTYAIYLNGKVPELLHLTAGVRERRHEPCIILALFSLMVISVPLAIIPTGSIKVAGAILGYVYGLKGLALAWPGFSIGLAFVFFLGRAMSSPKRDNAEMDSSPDLPIPFIDHRSAQALLRGIRRLLRDQPRRTAVLLTFATHSPLTQFLFGWGTDIGPMNSLLACAIDGIKAIVPLLEGMAIGDIAEIANMSEKHGSCWSGGMQCPAVVLKLGICVAFGIIFYLVGRAVYHEMQEMEEAGDALVTDGRGKSGAAGGMLAAACAEDGRVGEQELKYTSSRGATSSGDA